MVSRRVVIVMLMLGFASGGRPDVASAAVVAGMPARPRTSGALFACIGDFGEDTSGERAVASLVRRWNPDFIVTTGDNTTGALGFDTSVGKYYSEYVGGYSGAYGPGSTVNRFFACLGDHDWEDGGGLAAYLAYFQLPGTGIPTSDTSGNERYYDFGRGPVHFFVLDSNSGEPDGASATSPQAAWLRAQLQASTAPWKIVVLHHAPYSSGKHGSQTALQWPFQEWGASAVLAGHDHTYERIVTAGFPYFVNGLGGRGIYAFNPVPLPGSEVRYNADHGAMLISASEDSLVFRFYSVAGGPDGTRIDTYTLVPPPLPDTTLVEASAVWKYRDDGSDMGTAWRTLLFDDSSWASGPAALGYGDGGEATVVNCGLSAPTCSGPNYITTWFRRVFVVEDPSQYSGLDLGLMRDDGAVVYLNGLEILRSNMPAGPIDYTTLASSTVSGSAESLFVKAALPAAALLGGLDVLAVEIHQAGPWSSDISFALELRAGRRRPEPHRPPPGYILEQNSPNPFHPTTAIRYALPQSGRTSLRVFDARGRLVRILVDDSQAAGWHAALFSSGDLAPGVYFYRLESRGFTSTRKLVVLR